MKPVIDRQVEYILKDTILSYNKANKNISLNSIMTSIASSYLELQERKTMFPAIQIERYKPISLFDINANTRYLKADLHIIFDSIYQIGRELYNYERSITNKLHFNASNITRLRRKIDMLKMMTVGNSYTYQETFNNSVNINEQLSTNFKIHNGCISIDTIENSRPIKNNDVNIAIQDNGLGVSIHGSKPTMVINDLIDREPGKKVTLSFRSSTEIDLTATITITVNSPATEFQYNNILICPNFDIQTPATIKVYTPGINEPISVVSKIFNDNPISIQFDNNKISRIEISLFRSSYSLRQNSSYIYNFSFAGIEIRNKQNLKSATIISNKLQKYFPDDNEEPVLFDKIVLYASENIPLGSSVQYNISSDGENWHEIIPINRIKHLRNIVDFTSSQNIEQLINIETKQINSWLNILENRKLGNIPVYQLINNLPEDIIIDSIKLYRGYGDYSVTYSDSKILKSSDNLIHIFSSNTERFPLCEEPHVESLDIFYDNDENLYYIQPEYYVPFPDLLKIWIILGSYEYECDVEKTEDIYSDDSALRYTKVYIKQNDHIINATKAKIEFSAALRDIEKKKQCLIEIDELSIRVKTISNSESTIDQNHLSINQLDKTILIRNTIQKSNINPSKYQAFISFQYVEKRKTEYKTYTTNVVCFEETEINISPFTDLEINLGNFHSINGIDVSRRSNYILPIGTSIIKTTNPHKSSEHILDVNDLTGKHSNACIDISNILPENILGFSESLRLVSINKLTNVVSPKDHKVFAFHNGAIYINFIPEQLPNNINIYEYLHGKELCGKKAYYNFNDYTFNKYEVIPESFKIVYNKRSNTTSIDSFYYKIELLSNEGESVNPEIYNMSINLI